MGFFSRKKKEKEFSRFEKAVKKIWKAKEKKRADDGREAFLTPDLLKRRKQLTKGGKQNLVLQYGTKGDTISYTLKDLNDMAKSMDKAQGKFKEETKGAPVSELLKAARMRVDLWGKQKGLSDFRKATAEIGTAALYKIKGGTLHFRVTASGKTKYSHYAVRIRLEEWEKHIKGPDPYPLAAKKAAAGRVSVDCTCGRYQYWFRYLATIGGFALEPFEHVFPKIRNPRLIGAVCKHLAKALVVLQSPVVHIRLAKEMERQAKKRGWVSDKLMPKFKREKVSTIDDEFEDLEKAGAPDLEKEYRKIQRGKVDKEYADYAKAQAAFRKKAKEPRIKKMIKKLSGKLKQAKTERETYKAIAKEEKAKREQAEQDILKSKMEASLVRDVLVDKMDKADAVKKFAKANDLKVKEAQKMAEDIDV